jgi:hypothetical protein
MNVPRIASDSQLLTIRLNKSEQRQTETCALTLAVRSGEAVGQHDRLGATSMPSRRGTRALGRGRAWVVFGATHSPGSCESSRWLSNPNCVVIPRSWNVISLTFVGYVARDGAAPSIEACPSRRN